LLLLVCTLVRDYLLAVKYSSPLFGWAVKVDFVMAFHGVGRSLLSVFRGVDDLEFATWFRVFDEEVEG
jgi:hypothetical protein